MYFHSEEILRYFNDPLHKASLTCAVPGTGTQTQISCLSCCRKPSVERNDTESQNALLKHCANGHRREPNIELTVLEEGRNNSEDISQSMQNLNVLNTEDSRENRKKDSNIHSNFNLTTSDSDNASPQRVSSDKIVNSSAGKYSEQAYRCASDRSDTTNGQDERPAASSVNTYIYINSNNVSNLKIVNQEQQPHEKLNQKKMDNKKRKAQKPNVHRKPFWSKKKTPSESTCTEEEGSCSFTSYPSEAEEALPTGEGYPLSNCLDQGATGYTGMAGMGVQPREGNEMDNELSLPQPSNSGQHLPQGQQGLFQAQQGSSGHTVVMPDVEDPSFPSFDTLSDHSSGLPAPPSYEEL